MNTHVVVSAVVIICSFTICLCQNLEAGETCTTKAGTTGRCVVIRDCKAALDQIKNHERPQICNFNKLEPIVCCANTQLGNNGPIRNVPGAIAKQKCKEYLEEKKPERDGFVSAVNGIRALPKEFVHMAAIGFEDKGTRRWLCGGSLISDRFVLTAAHCVSSISYGRAKWVRLGDLNLEIDTDDAMPEDYDITRSIIHPQYNRKLKQNDIALFELSRPVTMSDYVKPACLHTDEAVRDLTATGWGLTSFTGEPSAHLIKVYLDQFNYSRCYEVFKKDVIDSETQLCIGSTAEQSMDTCQGDSGGPLQIKHPTYYTPLHKYYIVVGVTSYGKACGLQNVPGVYSKVSRYVAWIESVVWPQ